MKLSRVFLAGSAALMLAAAWGCGGGGDSSTQNALAAGRTELNKVAAGESPSDAAKLQSILDLFLQAIQQDPNSSEANFGAAVCMAGVVSAEVDGSDGTVTSPPPPSANGVVGPVVATPFAPEEPGEVPPTPPNPKEPVRPLPAHRFLGLIWNLDSGLSNPYTLLHMLAPITDLRMGLLPYYGYFEDDVARRQKMLERLNAVAEHLAKVEADPDFSVTLSVPFGRGSGAVPAPQPAPGAPVSPSTGANGASAPPAPAKTPPHEVTVGLPEVYLFDAYVQSLRAEVALSLAYIRDPGPNWQPPFPPIMANSGTAVAEMPFWSPAALDKNKDGKLTPDEYLPSSPFLTLRDAALLKTAQEAMLAVADRETKGIDGVLARPADGNFLVPNSPEIQESLTEVKSTVVPLIKQAATGPVTFEVPRYEVLPMMDAVVAKPASSVRSARKPSRKVFDLRPDNTSVDGPPPAPEIFPLPAPKMEKVTINVAAWFNNPPPDLKVFAPVLTLADYGWPDYTKSVYPDRTFGGLFPDGVRDDLPF